jgi:hypothetical protein
MEGSDRLWFELIFKPFKHAFRDLLALRRVCRAFLRFLNQRIALPIWLPWTMHLDWMHHDERLEGWAGVLRARERIERTNLNYTRGICSVDTMIPVKGDELIFEIFPVGTHIIVVYTANAVSFYNAHGYCVDGYSFAETRPDLVIQDRWIVCKKDILFIVDSWTMDKELICEPGYDRDTVHISGSCVYFKFGRRRCVFDIQSHAFIRFIRNVPVDTQKTVLCNYGNTYIAVHNVAITTYDLATETELRDIYVFGVYDLSASSIYFFVDIEYVIVRHPYSFIAVRIADGKSVHICPTELRCEPFKKGRALIRDHDRGSAKVRQVFKEIDEKVEYEISHGAHEWDPYTDVFVRTLPNGALSIPLQTKQTDFLFTVRMGILGVMLREGRIAIVRFDCPHPPDAPSM